MPLKVQIAELTSLDSEIRDLGGEFQEIALQSSVSDLVYILKRIYQLGIDVPNMEDSVYGEAASSSIILIEPSREINFYAQCLLLWSCRILYILEEKANIKNMPALKFARNILAAHYGHAYGTLKSKLTKGFISTKILPLDSLRLEYMIGHYEGPAVSATPDELQDIKEIYSKCFHDNQTPNWWSACYEILHCGKSEVTQEDIKK